MNFNTFSYLFKEGLTNVFKNKKTTIASLIITCFTMVTFGVFFVATGNMDKASQKIISKQGMEVFLFELDQENISRVGNEIQAIPGVKEIKYKSKEEALVQAKEDFKDTPALLEGYDEDNKLPASYIVVIEDLDSSNNIKNKVGQIQGVKNITIKDPVIQAASTLSKFVRAITIVILTFSVLGSILIISNTIKIALHSRAREISIMKYVGATDGFIRLPFLVQGALTGLFAAIISTFVVSFTYKVLIDQLQNSILGTFLTTVGFNEMVKLLVLIFLSFGIGIGIIGSYISMKKYLKV